MRAALAKIGARVEALSPPYAQLAAAVVLTLLAAAFRFVADAGTALFFAPLILFAVAMFAGMFLVVAGVGWLAARLIQTFVQWRLHAEVKEGTKGLELAWAVFFVLIFIGIPEIDHAVRWWQENLFSRIPGEPAALDRIAAQYLPTRDTVLGLLIVAVPGSWFFGNYFKEYRIWLRKIVDFARTLLVGRPKRIPIVLGLATAATIAVLMRYDNDRVGALLSVEFMALMLWVFIPVIAPNLIWIVPGLAVAGPALLIAQRVGAQLLGYALILLVWGAWLFSIAFVPRVWWRAPYWLGVLGFLGYLVRGMVR